MIIEQFADEGHWGLSTHLTIFDCDEDIIKDPKIIRAFIFDLVKFLKMQRYGEPFIERFGEGELFGYSAIQLIYTSSITMHFNEADNRAFIDIFSCKGYEPVEAAEYCQGYLMAKSYDMTWMFRD